MPSILDNQTGPGKPLSHEPPDTNEIAGLLRSGLARLQDSKNKSLSMEGRFDLAYNSAHALCLAALRRCGYRPRNRYIVFQALPHTLNLGPDVWRVLAKCHDMRNLAEYEGNMEITDRLLTDLIAAVQRVALALTPENVDKALESE